MSSRKTNNYCESSVCKDDANQILATYQKCQSWKNVFLGGPYRKLLPEATSPLRPTMPASMRARRLMVIPFQAANRAIPTAAGRATPRNSVFIQIAMRIIIFFFLNVLPAE